MGFNFEKCKVMHLGASNQKHMSLQCFVATELAGDRIVMPVNRRWMISVPLGEATLGILCLNYLLLKVKDDKEK